MSASLLLQYVLIALAVLWSAAYVVRRQWPQAVRRAQGRLALWLLRESRPAWSRRLGRRIAPAPALAGECGGCNACEPGPRTL
ncbi:MAG TPA: DUF6587 family protein [Lysobacter sp.]|nr:DUF6587 family protein [Lysobacter sp.]